MPLDIPRIHALCFDVDGTLNDTDDQFVRKLVKWLAPLRGLFPGKDPAPFARRLVMMTEAPGNYLLGLPDRLGIDNEISALGDFLYRIGLGKNPEPFVMIEGIQAMLKGLYPHFPMSIVSARGARTTQIFIKQYNLQPLFCCIATAQTCQHTKPYADPILWAAEQMGVRAENCLMIGDTTVDIQAGKAAGAQTVGVLCGFGEEKELRSTGADLILSSTTQLTEILFPLIK